MNAVPAELHPTKVCATCGEAKPLDAFATHKRDLDAEHSCNACFKHELDTDPDDSPERLKTHPFDRALTPSIGRITLTRASTRPGDLP